MSSCCNFTPKPVFKADLYVPPLRRSDALGRGGRQRRVGSRAARPARARSALGDVDDVLCGTRRDYFVGAQLKFNDEDLKIILPFAPSPSARALSDEPLTPCER